ncbi:MAG: hypothetical protein CSA74_04435 [Rhodobacterales bacterium]|nr:MAG: hypothetical protein CSA74_04435 [Rhodobacterales bacterium]
MFRATLFSLALAALANPALADEVTDTLSSALRAYEDGNIEDAIEELDYAKELLKEVSAQALTAFLPEPPEGWTREVSGGGMNAGLAFLGGGVAAEATYSNGTESFSLSIMADNPMVAGFAGVISNAGVLGLKTHRVQREKFFENDNQLMALIDKRILVQAEGASPAVMVPVLEMIDYEALENFGG